MPVSVAVAVIDAGSGVARLTGSGTLTESVGAVLSTVTVRVAETSWLPATSRVVTRRS